MKILLTGGTGFIGQALLPHLQQHQVYCLVRGKPSSQKLAGAKPIRSLSELDVALDAVVNLAGENISAKRWTAARKSALRASRIDLTRNLLAELEQQQQTPQVWLNASAVGYYGDSSGQTLSEGSHAGDDFAAQLCADWESVAQQASKISARVAIFRLGVVIGNGGVLAKLRLPFKLGFGAVMGPGPQYMPWVGLDDVVAALLWALRSQRASGIFNLVGPQPATQRQFAEAMAAYCHRPMLMRFPAWFLRILMGEMSSLLLVDQKVEPQRLLAADFEFSRPTIQAAIQASKV